MNRTHEYYRIAQAHKDALRAIWATYDDTMKRLERYKGSAGYEADEREAARVRDEAIKAQSQASAKAFDEVLKGMRDKVGGRAVVPPSDDELRLLQVLKLRDHTGDKGTREKVGLSREELQAAGRALQDNTMALHALDDIARSHGHYNLFISYPAWSDGESVHQRRIANLTESARRIVQMKKVDARRESASAVRNGDYNALSSLVVDRDFESERDAILFYANVGEADADTFMNAVND